MQSQTLDNPLRQRWWDQWDAACAGILRTYDLGESVGRDGRTAVTVWQNGAMVYIAVDQALANLLIAQDAGFLLCAMLQRALTQFVDRGGIVTVSMNARLRKQRRLWAAQHPVAV